jgi:hypothetical protein
MAEPADVSGSLRRDRIENARNHMWGLGLPGHAPAEQSFYCIDRVALFKNWCNIKHTFKSFKGKKADSMVRMLNVMGQELIGTHHSGIDDARNLAALFDGYTSKDTSMESQRVWPTGRQCRKAPSTSRRKYGKRSSRCTKNIWHGNKLESRIHLVWSTARSCVLSLQALARYPSYTVL